ncbi:MAG: hypothetical protein MUF27_03320 [Acidobacteria bacterium]|nr:hypothetical protein [Acidobacteriota bacterium]
MIRPERFRLLAAVNRTMADAALEVAWCHERDGAAPPAAVETVAKAGAELFNILAELREAGDL